MARGPVTLDVDGVAVTLSEWERDGLRQQLLRERAQKRHVQPDVEQLLNMLDQEAFSGPVTIQPPLAAALLAAIAELENDWRPPLPPNLALVRALLQPLIEIPVDWAKPTRPTP